MGAQGLAKYGAAKFSANLTLWLAKKRILGALPRER